MVINQSFHLANGSYIDVHGSGRLLRDVGDPILSISGGYWNPVLSQLFRRWIERCDNAQ